MSELNPVTRIQLLKAVSYRVLSSALGFVVLFATTGSIKLSGGYGLFELAGKPLLYFFHEKGWEGPLKRAMKKQ